MVTGAPSQPGRTLSQTSAQADSPYLQAQVFIAVKRYRDRAALETLIKGLGADLSRGLGRSPAR